MKKYEKAFLNGITNLFLMSLSLSRTVALHRQQSLHEINGSPEELPYFQGSGVEYSLFIHKPALKIRPHPSTAGQDETGYSGVCI